MRGGKRGIGGPQEAAADRETCEALDLVDARLLQQRQGIAAGTDEDELGVQLALFTAAAVPDGQGPTAVGLAGHGAHLVTEQYSGTGAHAVADELSGQRTEVDVRAVGGPVEGNRLGKIAFGGHERQSAGELVRIVYQLGGGEQRVARQRVAAPPQIVDAGSATYK